MYIKHVQSIHKSQVWIQSGPTPRNVLNVESIWAINNYWHLTVTLIIHIGYIATIWVQWYFIPLLCRSISDGNKGKLHCQLHTVNSGNEPEVNQKWTGSELEVNQKLYRSWLEVEACNITIYPTILIALSLYFVYIFYRKST